MFMILEVKESLNHVSVYGYDDICEWLSDIVAAYETDEMLNDFIPLYLSIKLNGQYVSIVDEGKLDEQYKKVMTTISRMPLEDRKIGNLEKIVIGEAEQDMLVVFQS